MELLEAARLDQILFCPSGQNPLKANPLHALPTHRKKMVELAIAGIDGFGSIETELWQEAPCYTVDTLHQLKKQLDGSLPAYQLFLLLGEDAAATFYRWHQPEEIVQLATPLVGSRLLPERKPCLYEGSPSVVRALQEGSYPTRLFELSSSEVRQRLKEQKAIEHLLPQDVWRYIRQEGLYAS